MVKKFNFILTEFTRGQLLLNIALQEIFDQMIGPYNKLQEQTKNGINMDVRVYTVDLSSKQPMDLSPCVGVHSVDFENDSPQKLKMELDAGLFPDLPSLNLQSVAFYQFLICG